MFVSSSNVSQELQESIMTMLMNKARQSIQQPGQTAPTTPQQSKPPVLAPGTLPSSALAGLQQQQQSTSAASPLPPQPPRMPMMERLTTSNSTVLNQGLTSSLNTTPGSPAKTFPQQPVNAFNPIQSLASQLQGKCLQ